MNKVLLVGRLTKDPETRTNASGDMVITRFTIAVDRKYKKENEPTADFLNCISFSKTAEFINRYFTKGRRIGIEGRIQTGKYTNKEGNTVYTTDIAVDNAEFVDSKSEASGGGEASAPQTSQTKTPPPAPGDDFMQVPDSWEEELPFN